jgi:hypothetical protein
MIDAITKNLGDKADYYLGFKNPKIAKEKIHVPTGDWVDRIFAPTDRNNRVLVNLQRLFGTGRLAGTGYLSILPVDQGIEHAAGASFAKNPSTSTPRTSSSSPSRAAATPSRRPTASSAWSPASTPTRSRSW